MIETFLLNFVGDYFFLLRAARAEKRLLGIFMSSLKRFKFFFSVQKIQVFCSLQNIQKFFCCVCDDYNLKFLIVEV